MPSFKNMNDINMDEYFDTSDQNLKDVFHLAVVSNYTTLINFFITFTVKDYIKSYEDYFKFRDGIGAAENEVTAAQAKVQERKKSYDDLVMIYFNQQLVHDQFGNPIVPANAPQGQPATIPMSKKDYDTLGLAVSAAEKELRQALKTLKDKNENVELFKNKIAENKAKIEKYMNKDGKLDTFKIFEDIKPKTPEDKKKLGARFCNFLKEQTKDATTSSRNYKLTNEQLPIFKYPINFEAKMSKEDRKVLDDKAAEFAGRAIFKIDADYKNPEAKPEEIKAEAKPGEIKVEEKPEEIKVDAKPGEIKVEAKPGEIKVEAKPEEIKVEAKPGEVKVDAKKEVVFGEIDPEKDKIIDDSDSDEDDDEYDVFEDDDDYKDEYEDIYDVEDTFHDSSFPTKIEKKVKENEQAMLNTAQANTTPSEKLWFRLLTGSRLNSIEEVDYEYFENAGLNQKHCGFPDDGYDCKNEVAISNQSFNELVNSLKLRDENSDVTIVEKNVEDAIRLFLETDARISIEVGKEVKRLEDKVLYDTDYKHEKALHLVSSGESLPKTLMRKIHDDYKLFERPLREAIRKTVSFTPDTTLREVIDAMNLPLDQKNKLLYKESDIDKPIKDIYGEEDCIKKATGLYTQNVFNRIEEKVKKEVDEKYSKDKENAAFKEDGDKLKEHIPFGAACDEYLLEDDWVRNVGDKYKDKTKDAISIHTFQVTDKLVTGGSKIALDKNGVPENLFQNNDIKVKQQEIAPENEAEQTKKAEQNKKDDSDDEEEEIIPEERIILPWFNRLLPGRDGEFSKKFPPVENFTDLNKALGMYAAEDSKNRFAVIGSGLIMNDKRNKALKSLGMGEASLGVRTSHYMMWLLGTQDGVSFNNLMSAAENKENKQAYLKFLENNSLNEGGAGEGFDTKYKQWKSIIEKATQKAMSYKMPKIDYMDPFAVNSHIEELYLLRKLSEDAGSIIQCFEMDNDVMLHKNREFWNRIENNTRSLNEAYINTPMPYKYGELNELIKNTAKNRFITGKRLNKLSGKQLDTADYKQTNRDTYKFNNIIDSYFRSEADKLFRIDNAVIYLGGRSGKNYVKKLNRVFDNIVKDGYAKSFERLHHRNAANFRMHLNDSNNRNGEFEKSINRILETDESAEKMAGLLSGNNNLRKWVYNKFSTLYPEELSVLFDKNKIDKLSIFLIDGKTPDKMWGEKYKHIKSVEDKNSLYMLEIVKAFFNKTGKIEIKNYAIDKNEKLTESGKFHISSDPVQVEKMTEAVYMLKENNASILKKLEKYKERLIKALAPIENESQREKERRFRTDGTSLYQEMAQSLQNAIDTIKDDKSGPDEIRNAIIRLNTASDKYFDKRKGTLYGPRSQMGIDRLGVSADIKNELSPFLMTYDNIRRKLNIDYTVSGSNMIPAEASREELLTELKFLDKKYNKIYNTNIDKRDKEFSEKYKLQFEKNAAMDELVHLLNENIPGVNIDMNYKNSDIFKIIKDKSGATSLQKATNYITRRFIEEALAESSTADDIRNMSYLVKSGKMKRDIYSLAGNKSFQDIIYDDPKAYYNDVKNAGILVDSIEDIFINRADESAKILSVDVMRREEQKLYEEKLQNIAKYDIKSNENKTVFLGSKYYHNESETDEEAANRKDNKINICRIKDVGGYTLFRTAGFTIAFLALALEKKDGKPKYTIEQLLDSKTLAKEKSEKFEEIVTLMKTAGDKNNPKAAEANKTLAGILYNGEIITAKACDDLALKIDFNSANYESSKEFAMLIGLCNIRADARQEPSHCEKEIMELVKAEKPEFKNYKQYSEYTSDALNPVSALVGKYGKIDKDIKSIEGNKPYLPSIFAANIITVSGVKSILKQYQNSGKKKGFTEWSIDTNATVRSRQLLNGAIGGGTDLESAGDIFFKQNLDAIKNGSLFRGINYTDDNPVRPNHGIKGFPDVQQIAEDMNYNKLTRAEYRLKEDEAVAKLSSQMNNATDQRKQYILKAINSIHRITEYLKYDYVINDNTKEELNNCFKNIISERWSEVFAKNGLSGNKLKIATRNATEYMMVHDKALRYISPALFDRLAFENYADQLVKASDNGLFIGKAAIAMHDLKNKDYGNNKSALVQDAAYAMTAQILRVHGRIPNDVNTDTAVTAEQYFKTAKKSTTFVNSLMHGNPPSLKSNKDIYKMFSNDKAAEVKILEQEKAVVDARVARRKAERERQMAMNRTTYAKANTNANTNVNANAQVDAKAKTLDVTSKNRQPGKGVKK